MLIQRRIAAAAVVYVLATIVPNHLAVAGPAGGEASDPNKSSKYLNAVREFADSHIHSL